MKSRGASEDLRFNALPGIGYQVWRDGEHFAFFENIQIRHRILDTRGAAWPQHDFNSERIVPLQFCRHPLCCRGLTHKEGRRLSAANDGRHEFMARPMRRRDHYASSLSDGLIEEIDGFVEPHLIEGWRCRNSVVESWQRIGQEPAEPAKIQAFSLHGHIWPQR